MLKPLCEICEKRHWTYEPHKLPNTENRHLTSPNEESPNNERIRSVQPPRITDGSPRMAERPQAGGRDDGGAVRTQRELPDVRLGMGTGTRPLLKDLGRGPQHTDGYLRNMDWRNRHRGSYNSYMKEYMRKRRSRA